MTTPQSTKDFFKSFNELLKKDFQLKDIGNLFSLFKNLGGNFN